MFGLGVWELVVILVMVVIVFGVGKLPELGTGLGEGIKNFKKAYRDAQAIDVTGVNPRAGAPGAAAPGAAASGPGTTTPADEKPKDGPIQ